MSIRKYLWPLSMVIFGLFGAAWINLNRGASESMSLSENLLMTAIILFVGGFLFWKSLKVVAERRRDDEH